MIQTGVFQHMRLGRTLGCWHKKDQISLDRRIQICYIIDTTKEEDVANTFEEKKRYVKEYVRSVKAIEDAMEPYKEQKRELRKEYREQGWLNTDEIRAAIKAYRLYRDKMNIDEVYENFKIITGEGEEQ
tara:strand:+ start:93 stop:479 length:387 start_codon:yes stop_codon:yes gene_type:complete